MAGGPAAELFGEGHGFAGEELPVVGGVGLELVEDAGVVEVGAVIEEAGRGGARREGGNAGDFDGATAEEIGGEFTAETRGDAAGGGLPSGFVLLEGGDLKGGVAVGDLAFGGIEFADFGSFEEAAADGDDFGFAGENVAEVVIAKPVSRFVKDVPEENDHECGSEESCVAPEEQKEAEAERHGGDFFVEL